MIFFRMTKIDRFFSIYKQIALNYSWKRILVIIKKNKSKKAIDFVNSQNKNNMKLCIILIGFGLFPILTFAQSDFYSLNYQPMELSGSTQGCFDNFDRKLKVPGDLTIAVALGYSDTIDEHADIVTDQFLLNTLKYQITGACKYDNQGFCGFTVVSEEPHKPYSYTRDIYNLNHQKITANLHIMSSSYDFSNRANQTTFKTEQNEKSNSAINFYGWALKNADIVFYEGHSRDGGGPDFSPPRKASSGKVDYSWYRLNQPGFKFLINSLSDADQSPMTLGLFSCASKVHFQDKLSKMVPQTNLILSTKVVEAQYSKKALLESIESVLNFECGSQLERRLKGTSFILKKGI